MPMNDDTTVADPGPCSVCQGLWIADLKYAHHLSCRRYTPETATTAADHERGYGIREATDTEMELIDEHEYQRPTHTDDRFLIRFSHSGGIHRRVVLIGTGPQDNERAHRGIGGASGD